MFSKAFNIQDYGLCYVTDMVREVAEGSFVVEEAESGEVLVNLFRKE